MQPAADDYMAQWDETVLKHAKATKLQRKVGSLAKRSSGLRAFCVGSQGEPLSSCAICASKLVMTMIREL
jgi:hypothetical protein